MLLIMTDNYDYIKGAMIFFIYLLVFYYSMTRQGFYKMHCDLNDIYELIVLRISLKWYLSTFSLRVASDVFKVSRKYASDFKPSLDYVCLSNHVSCLYLVTDAQSACVESKPADVC